MLLCCQSEAVNSRLGNVNVKLRECTHGECTFTCSDCDAVLFYSAALECEHRAEEALCHPDLKENDGLSL